MRRDLEVGEFIRERRLEAKLSVQNLADLMPGKCYAMMISRLERAERSLSLEEAVYLSKILSCSLEDLARPFLEDAKEWSPNPNAVKAMKLRKRITALQQELRELENPNAD